MTITITGYTIIKSNHEVRIFAENSEFSGRRYIDREGDIRENSDDVVYFFDTEDEKVFKYLTNWLKKQKATSDAKTYGEALNSIIGITTQSPNLSYCHKQYMRNYIEDGPLTRK